jgi:Lysine-specific metallo-endopeptidase
MGFNNAGLGPSDQQIISTLQPVIIDTLRRAAGKIQQGGGKAESKRWFGDESDTWMKQLTRNLDMLASMINVKSIDVGFSNLHKRCSGTFAAAPMPSGGWRNFVGGPNPMTAGQGQGFRIWLNLSWNSAPLYRPGIQPADSKFQTLVHECTHLFLNTDDGAYGVSSCEGTAANTPNIAKKTADCWGYFVEEFR